jgi:hypothetical protein
MLQSTLSSLGQAIGWRKGRPDRHPPVHEDRRIWVRYPCDVEAVCQPADNPQAQRVSARVRNVSRGGINLIMAEPVATGSLMSVELPCASSDKASTVLAYVVRVAACDHGEWSIGCTFASELNDNDLKPFGAKRRKPHPLDQRTWVRFPCSVQATYQLIKSDEPKSNTSQVVNISANGVGLVAGQRVDLGRLLNLELRGTDGKFTLSILACVVRLTPQADGTWELGCNLIRELTDKEIKSLL